MVLLIVTEMPSDYFITMLIIHSIYCTSLNLTLHMHWLAAVVQDYVNLGWSFNKES